MNLNISNHARERFAERIMNKKTDGDIAVYVANHLEVIDERINKMVEYGEKLYSGKSMSEYNKTLTDVYLKDTWVIIVDTSKQKVITLYSIDLGLGDDFNKDYLNRLLAKLELAKMDFKNVENNIIEQRATYENIINQNEAMINENKRINNELTKQNDGFKEVINGLNTQLEIAMSDIREIVGVLVGRKVY